MKNKKVFKPYERKVSSIDLDVKDISFNTRQVKVVLSKMGVLDSDRDIISVGAFSKSLSERGVSSPGNRKIGFLRNHDWDSQIGKWTELYEEGDELIGIGYLGNSTKGSDALSDYDDGILREHSIGFNYVEDKIAHVDDTKIHESGYWRVDEVHLWEGSGVTFGANEQTPTLSVTKGNKVEILDKVNRMMTGVQKALKNGKGSDERLFSLEMQLKTIQDLYNQIILIEPGTVKDVHSKEKPIIEKVTSIDLTYLKNFKL